MNNALQVTSGYAGLTRGAMRELAQDVSAAGTLTVGAAKDIVTQLVASGRIGAQSIGAVAKLAEDYAAHTGREIDKIAPDLVKLFEDPAKSAAELNKQMHSMSPAFIEHLSHLQRIGQVEEARLALAEKFGPQLAKQIDQLGTIDRTLNIVKKSWSEFWDAAFAIGRTPTLEDKLAQVQSQLEVAQKRANLNPNRNQEAVSILEAQVTALKFAQADVAQGTAKKSAAATANELQQQAAALVNQT